MCDVPLPENHDNIYESPLLTFIKDEIVGEVLEDTLDHFDISLPDSDRENVEGEARIFGETYDIVAESIESKIVTWLSEVLPGIDISNLIMTPYELRHLNANIQTEEMVQQ